MNHPTNTNELYFILEKQVALHRNLADVLQEEYAHMGAVDVKGLGEAAHAKEVLLSEIWNLESLRIKLVEKLAGELGLLLKDANLQTIAAALPRAEGEKLQTIRTALNMLISEAKDLNARNMGFVENSLVRIEQLKRNALGLTNKSNKENYSNNGVRQPLPDQGGRLLSTEA